MNIGKTYNFSREDKLNDYHSFLEAGTGSVWASFRACDIVANSVMQTGFNLINEESGNFIDNDRTGLMDLIRNLMRWIHLKS